MSNAKVLRGQMRQIVKELLPELIDSEFQKEQYKKLADEIMARLAIIEKHVASTLAEVNKRSKETTSYMMSQTIAASPVLMPKVGGEDEKN